MKKLLCLAAVAAMTFAAVAEDAENETGVDDDEITVDDVEPPHKRITVWPAFFAVGEIPETPDMIGLRLTIPWSTVQQNVTGFDIGLWGRASYFEGGQFNLLRNDVKDRLSGAQVGLYNTASQIDSIGAQVGLWNECGSIRGAQLGIVNTAGQVEGVQIGFINRAEEVYGFQIGIINVIRDAEISFCPVFNVGF